MQACPNGQSGTATGATSNVVCATCVKGKYVRAAAPLVGGACVDCVVGKYGNALLPVSASDRTPVGFVAENAACTVLFS